jgi:hypothetical protein
MLKIIVYGTELALLGVVTGVIGRPGPWKGADPGRPAREVLEHSLVLLLMVLLSPMSSKPHFATLLLPAFCLARAAVVHRARIAGTLLACAILAAGLTMKDLATANLASLAMWFGGVSWAAIFLLAGCAFLLRRRAHGASSSVAPPEAGFARAA